MPLRSDTFRYVQNPNAVMPRGPGGDNPEAMKTSARTVGLPAAKHDPLAAELTETGPAQIVEILRERLAVWCSAIGVTFIL